jgi:hypothetical protein
MNAPGQITRTTQFGAALFAIASQPHLNIFLDVGTWEGGGSVKVLVEATANNSLAQIYSVEANVKMYETAKKNWTPCPDRLKLLWGRIATRMMSEVEILNHHLFPKIKPHFDLHYNQDVEDFMKAPMTHLPPYCDVAVLDGSEWCGRSDLETVLSLRPKIIALDDINVIKNDGNYRQLLSSGEWHVIARGEDKTGWAILQRGSSAAADFRRYIDVGLGPTEKNLWLP